MCRAKSPFEGHSALVTPSIVRCLGQPPFVSSQHRLGGTGASSPVQLVPEVANPAVPANGHDEPAGRH